MGWHTIVGCETVTSLILYVNGNAILLLNCNSNVPHGSLLKNVLLKKRVLTTVMT